MDVDKMLAHAGDFGRYQYLLMLLFSVINILSTFDYFGQLFIFVQPEYWCRLPELTDVPLEDRRRMWSPPEDSSCSRYDINLTTVGVVNGTPDWSGKNRTVRACDAGWEYNLTDGYQSIVSEVSIAPLARCSAPQSLLSFAGTWQLVQNVPEHEGDKAAMFGDTIKGTPTVLVARSQPEVTEICFLCSTCLSVCNNSKTTQKT